MIIEPTQGPLGAVVTDLQLPELFELGDLNAALEKHHLLIFPDQELSIEQLLTFARLWGEPVEQPPMFTELPGQPERFVVGVPLECGLGWHIDGEAQTWAATHEPLTPRATLLYVLHAPPVGSDTLFTLDDAIQPAPEDIYTVKWTAPALAVFGPIRHKATRYEGERKAYRIITR